MSDRVIVELTYQVCMGEKKGKYHQYCRDCDTSPRFAFQCLNRVDSFMSFLFYCRNWMSMLAYEKAENGDYSIINELMLLLEQPYDEHTHELEARWYLKTPDWAKGMPGTEFLS